MVVYFSVFALALVYYFTTKNRASQSKLLLAIFLFSTATFVGLGDMIGGYDRYIYGEIFDNIANETRGEHNYRQLFYFINGDEYGYFLWQVLISFITANRYVFILITTFFMYFMYYKVLSKYTENYPLACILFLGFFYYFTMTYLRQAIAVGIVWLSFRYIWERRPFPFFLLILFAYSFHNAAAIFIPMYFLPIKKYSKETIIFFFTICLIIGISPLPALILENAGDFLETQKRMEAYTTNELIGFRWEYLLEVVFFIIVFFTNYDKIGATKKDLTFFNAALAFCGILLLFIRFGQGGRFGWFFLIGIIYLLSKLSTGITSYQWMKFSIILLCFTLFIRISLAWYTLLIPYKTFLTNGEPSGTTTLYERYEYDYNYTTNKLYR